jgi:hypothetical protein
MGGEMTHDELIEKYPKIFRDCRYLALGPGWLPLLDRLCAGLSQYAVAVQVKEKFGGLRFYMDTYTDEDRALIQAAEDESRSTCEECGAPGTTQSRGGWLLTLCPTCAVSKGCATLEEECEDTREKSE